MLFIIKKRIFCLILISISFKKKEKTVCQSEKNHKNYYKQCQNQIIVFIEFE